MTALAEMFLRELQEKHDVETAVFLVDCAHYLQTALDRVGPRFQIETPRKSECHRTDFPRIETPNFVVLELFQPRQTEYYRTMDSIFRSLAQCH